MIKNKSTQGNMLKGYNLKPLFILMGPPMIGITYALISLTRSQGALVLIERTLHQKSNV